MINLYYSEAYWGHSATMNGPHKVIDNLIKSLDEIGEFIENTSL